MAAQPLPYDGLFSNSPAKLVHRLMSSNAVHSGFRPSRARGENALRRKSLSCCRMSSRPGGGGVIAKRNKRAEIVGVLVPRTEPCALGGQKLLCDELGQDRRLVRGEVFRPMLRTYSLRTLRSPVLHVLVGAGF